MPSSIPLFPHQMLIQKMKYEEIIDLRRVSVTSQRHKLSPFMKAKMFECHLTAFTLLYTLLTIDDQLCDFIWVVIHFGKGITGY